jgi:hypothetical protein
MPIRVGFLAVIRRQRDARGGEFSATEYWPNSLPGFVLGTMRSMVRGNYLIIRAEERGD